jgi:hypothetical protein
MCRHHLAGHPREEGEQQADADEHVDDREELAGRGLGREVAVADGRERRDAEVERVDP